MVTFGALHNSEFKSLRGKIIRHQLSFTVLIAEGTFPPGDDFAGALSSMLCPDLEPEYRIHETGAQVSQNGGPYPPLEVEIEQEEYNTPHRAWTELVNLLLTLPPTVRLSHLVEKLEYVQKLTTSSELPTLSAFREDVECLLGLARELDERLLKANHFSKDVQREM